MSDQPVLLTQIQICRLLGIGVQTWRDWRKAQLTPEPAPLPGRPRWRVEDIERFIGQRQSSGRHYFGSVAKLKTTA